MIPPDDALINITAQGNVFGLQGLPMAFANWIPHFLWPNKGLSAGAGGNYYAHEIGGVVSEEDTTTGISFTLPGKRSTWRSGLASSW